MYKHEEIEYTSIKVDKKYTQQSGERSEKVSMYPLRLEELNSCLISWAVLNTASRLART